MKIVLLMTYVLLISQNAFSWGGEGHEIVAIVAKKFLTPSSKSKITALLGNPDIEKVASWADVIKNNPEYAYTKSWHFVNTENGRTVPPNGRDEDLIEALSKMKSQFKDSKSTREEKIFALKMLIHLVGDLYQPLHCGYLHDRGGNDVKINFLGRDMNLHAFWDSGMIGTQNLSSEAYAQKLVASNLTVESFAVNDVISRNVADLNNIYRFTNNRVDTDYITKNIHYAEQNLFNAGKNLADFLNTNL